MAVSERDGGALLWPRKAAPTAASKTRPTKRNGMYRLDGPIDEIVRPCRSRFAPDKAGLPAIGVWSYSWVSHWRSV